MIEEQITPVETYVVDSFEVFCRDRWQRIYRAMAVAIRDDDLAKEAVDEAIGPGLRALALDDRPFP